MASDGNGVFAATGNRTGGGSSHAPGQRGGRADHRHSARAPTLFYPVALAGDGQRGRRLRVDQPDLHRAPGRDAVEDRRRSSRRTGTSTCSTRPRWAGSSGATRSTSWSPAASMSIHTAPAAYRTAMGLYCRLQRRQQREHVPGRRQRPRGRRRCASRRRIRRCRDRLVRADVRPDDRADRDHHRRPGERHRLVHERRTG